MNAIAHEDWALISISIGKKDFYLDGKTKSERYQLGLKNTYRGSGRWVYKTIYLSSKNQYILKNPIFRVCGTIKYVLQVYNHWCGFEIKGGKD